MSFRKVVIMLLAAVMLAGVVSVSAPAQAAEIKGEKGYTNREVKMLASLIYCEAGNQSYAGKLAVGCVVMNRRRSKSFPNSIEGVIKQRGQFGPVAQGKLSREMRRYRAGAYKRGGRKESLKAAKAALQGQDYVKTRGKKVELRRFHFFNGHLSNAKIRIGGHSFK